MLVVLALFNGIASMAMTYIAIRGMTADTGAIPVILALTIAAMFGLGGVWAYSVLQNPMGTTQ